MREDRRKNLQSQLREKLRTATASRLDRSRQPAGLPDGSRRSKRSGDLRIAVQETRASRRDDRGVGIRTQRCDEVNVSGTPPGCLASFRMCPEVSLRSTSGYHLTPLRGAVGSATLPGCLRGGRDWTRRRRTRRHLARASHRRTWRRTVLGVFQSSAYSLQVIHDLLRPTQD